MTLFDRGRVADAVRRRCGYQLPRVGARLAGFTMRRLPQRIDCELFPGIVVPLDLDQSLQAAAFWTGERFERPSSEIVRRWLVGADRFFDIGANFGWYSYLALSASPTVQVHSFEPQPALHAVLEQVRDRNGLNDRLHPEARGISDADDVLELRVLEDELGHSTFGPHPEHGSGQPIAEVKVTSFDGWRRETGLALPATPTWVAKVDIEGFEARAIAGMRETLEARAFRGIVMELNEFTLELCGSSVAEVRAALAASGYKEDPSLAADRGLNAFFVPA